MAPRIHGFIDEGSAGHSSYVVDGAAAVVDPPRYPVASGRALDRWQ